MTPSSTSSSDPWRRFFVALIGAGGGMALFVYLFVVLVDPYGVLPVSLPFDRGPVDSNARYAFPMLARDEKFDSIILGTSTSRLLRPVALDAAFGTHFANLAMNSATAYEQTQMLTLFLAHHPAPRMILFGLDAEWCKPAVDFTLFTDRPFPAWMYSGSPWKGFLEMADLYSIEKAGQAFAEWTGLKHRVYGGDGYTQFVPDEKFYDPARVAEHMKNVGPMAPPPDPGADVTKWPLPGIDLLRDDLRAIPKSTRKILVFMPYNHRLIALKDGAERTLLTECKRRVAALAAATAGAAAIDFMIASPITMDDNNYWDPLHYRVGISARIVTDIAAALRGETSADDRLLAAAPTGGT
jgi:hypothetical protein